MKKIIILITCVLNLITFPAVSFADKSGFGEMLELMNKTTFLSSDTSTTLENGLVINFDNPIAEGTIGNLGSKYWVTSDLPDMFSYSYTLTLVGVSTKLFNASNQVLIIRWAESAISIGDFSGIPFLGGMKYADAGNPSATPDTIIAPGQSIQKDIYIPRTSFDQSWEIKGMPIPKQDGLNILLTIKVTDGNNNSKYFNLHTPKIGIPINSQK